jgi:leucyl aminopeptidase
LICENVYFARDLTNTNADEVNPQYLVKVSLDLAKKLPRVKATILDKKKIQKEKMGLLLAVNQGSHLDPAVIVLEYKGSANAKEHTVLIGKGITYDTGGLNIKSGGMETMKCDMAGAAVVLAIIRTAAMLELPVHLTAVIPTTENAVSATSYKPGDVYTSMTGKTVEIANTDAEGRLILADAIAYAKKYLKPSRIIDFATLTGGIEIALGSEATGMMSNDDALADLFIRAGSETFERVWRMPLFEEYKDNLKSDVADIKNVGTRSASSCTAGIFLQQFVEKTPWVHFDIACTAYFNEAKRYQPKFGTGIGVRLMIEFLKQLYP